MSVLHDFARGRIVVVSHHLQSTATFVLHDSIQGSSSLRVFRYGWLEGVGCSDLGFGDQGMFESTSVVGKGLPCSRIRVVVSS